MRGQTDAFVAEAVHSRRGATRSKQRISHWWLDPRISVRNDTAFGTEAAK